MYVEVDLFSGRPNPGWNTSSEDRELLLKLLSGLQRSSSTPEYQGLGYRGFKLFDEISGLRYIIRHDTVWRQDGSSVTCSKDPCERIESMLLACAQANLKSSDFSAIAEFFNQPLEGGHNDQ